MNLFYGIKVPKDKIDTITIPPTWRKIALGSYVVFGKFVENGIAPCDFRVEITNFALENLKHIYPEICKANAHFYPKFYEI